MTSDIEEYDTENKGFSIASFVLGIIGLLFCPLIAGVLAIVFAGISMKRKQGIRGLTIAGLVLGIIDCALCLIIILVIALVVILAFAFI